jgi:hypothetical protein
VRPAAAVAIGAAAALAATALLPSRRGGGPDDVRRAAVAEIAQAVKCMVADGERVVEPIEVLHISPACLTPQRALELRDPATGEPYAITRPARDIVRVCATLDRPGRARSVGFGEVDGDGCVEVFLAPS